MRIVLGLVLWMLPAVAYAQEAVEEASAGNGWGLEAAVIGALIVATASLVLPFISHRLDERTRKSERQADKEEKEEAERLHRQRLAEALSAELGRAAMHFKNHILLMKKRPKKEYISNVYRTMTYWRCPVYDALITDILILDAETVAAVTGVYAALLDAVARSAEPDLPDNSERYEFDERYAGGALHNLELALVRLDAYTDRPHLKFLRGIGAFKHAVRE